MPSAGRVHRSPWTCTSRGAPLTSRCTRAFASSIGRKGIVSGTMRFAFCKNRLPMFRDAVEWLFGEAHTGRSEAVVPPTPPPPVPPSGERERTEAASLARVRGGFDATLPLGERLVAGTPHETLELPPAQLSRPAQRSALARARTRRPQGTENACPNVALIVTSPSSCPGVRGKPTSMRSTSRSSCGARNRMPTPAPCFSRISESS